VRKILDSIQKYLGTAETLLKKLEQAQRTDTPLKIKAEEFGSVFIAHQLEKMVDTIGIVDQIVPTSLKETGPSIGEYFFYAWANRLIDPKSKNSIGKWLAHTASDMFRPIDTEQLNSKRYWDKWSRVSVEHIEAIGKEFFRRIWEMQKSTPQCVLFDTTNYYSYLDSKTESQLLKRGHNKAGKHQLRQIGLALMVDKQTRLPLFYREYAGNEHDSHVFNRIIDEMFGVLCGFDNTKERLTVVFDKGMNSEDNIAHIDGHQRVHFITTYSTYFAEDIAATDFKHFAPLNITYNQQLNPGCQEDAITAFRTSFELWGKQRTVVVTFNPKTRRKKMLRFEQKLEQIRETLLLFRRNYREQRPHWRNFETILQRYQRLCEQMHIGSQYYQLELSDKNNELSFRKISYQVSKAEMLFGKNIIVTDNSDWSTDEIVQASLDRWGVEKAFRDTKSPRHIATHPMYHWTDSKIRCHLLCCVIALTISRLLELQLEPRLGVTSATSIIEEMRDLHSLLVWYPGQKKPQRQLEEPTQLQKVVLNSFGYTIDDS